MNLTGIDLNPIKVQNAVPVPSQRIWILVRATPCGAVGCVSSRCTCISRLGASWVDSFRRFAAEQSADLPGVGTDVFFFFRDRGSKSNGERRGKADDYRRLPRHSKACVLPCQLSVRSPSVRCAGKSIGELRRTFSVALSGKRFLFRIAIPRTKETLCGQLCPWLECQVRR
jgi:hypothetical protein